LETIRVRYQPGRRALVLARAGAAGSWGLVCIAAVTTVVGVARGRTGRYGVWALAALGASLLPALYLTGRAHRLMMIEAQAPLRVAEQRRHGELPSAATHGRGSLRSVGAGGAAVAARTDTQLGALTVLPGVRIFRGIRASHPFRVIATHAVSAGRVVVLVESVAWPPGDYRVDPDGQVWCDGLPTGQTTVGLQAAVAACRRRLPRDHLVRALICVHRTAAAGYLLPAPGRTVSWTFAEDLVETLMPHLAPYAAAVSRHVVAALA
jgi:hypothetical protein